VSLLDRHILPTLGDHRLRDPSQAVVRDSHTRLGETTGRPPGRRPTGCYAPPATKPRAGDRPRLDHGRRLLTGFERFYRRAASFSAPEAHRLAETIEGWWPAVEAAPNWSA
jgi:hypothetical protein